MTTQLTALKTDNNKMMAELEKLAQKHFSTDTFETRNSDSLDFYDVAIWSIKEALTAAYMAGHEQGQKELSEFDTK